MRNHLLTLIAILLLSPAAQAYDVDIAHAPLTALSIELYNSCFPGSTLYHTAAAQKRLIQGNRGMDTGKADMLSNLDLSQQEIESLRGASAFHLTKRIGNWLSTIPTVRQIPVSGSWSSPMPGCGGT